MGVLTIPNEITVDFHQSKYVAVNAKQGDINSRNIVVSCSNRGKFFKLNQNYHIVYVRFKRPDNKGLFSRCDITSDGKISVKLTNGMLDVAGRCHVDLIVLDKLHSTVDPNYSGVFVSQVEDDGNGNITLTQIPTPIVTDDQNGNVVIASLETEDGIVAIPNDPYPFVKGDEDGNVVMASISSTGEIEIPDANVATTMTFYVNVIPSVFSEGIELI